MSGKLANFPSLGWVCSEKAFQEIYMMEVYSGSKPVDDGYDDVWRIQITLKSPGGNVSKVQVGSFQSREAAEMSLSMVATELNNMFARAAPESPLQGHAAGIEDRPAWGNPKPYEANVEDCQGERPDTRGRWTQPGRLQI